MEVFFGIYACFLMVAIFSAVTTGMEKVGPAAVIKNLNKIISPVFEPYAELQIKLEDIVERKHLYLLPENERNKKEIELLAEPEIQEIIQKCRDFQYEPTCNSPIYRKYDGTCNNVNHPKWGSSNIAMERLMPPSFEGIRGVRKSVHDGGELPDPRRISLKMKDENNPSRTASAFFTFFGQNIAHDISLLPVMSKNGKEIPCCEQEEKNHSLCMSSTLEKDDIYFAEFNRTCLPFTRAAPYPLCNFAEKRNVFNLQTSFIDASTTYAGDGLKASFLRRHDGTGKLKIQLSKFGDLLPQNIKQDAVMCPINQTYDCFASGDEKVNQHVMLTAVQTILLRFHNDIAEKLHRFNPHWRGETIYQETRRIVIAVYQYIIYKEYLPLLVGPDIMKEYLLSVDEESLYDPRLNPGALIEFTTASFRLHSMVPGSVSKYLPNTRFHGTFANLEIPRQGKIELMLVGSSEIASEKIDQFMKIDVSSQLYRPPKADYGGDLTTTDIKRGRDLGLPPYVDVIRMCSKEKTNIDNFSDLRKVMKEDNIKLLQSIYKNVSDIDLWVGIQMEPALRNSVAGFTTACISAAQFYRLKYGDSFFVTHKNSRYPLTKGQLYSVRNYSLAQMMCQAGDVFKVRKHPLLLQSNSNPLISCKSLPSLDLTPWNDPLPTSHENSNF